MTREEAKQTAERIVSCWPELFPENSTVTEIPTGFNNHLFSVNDAFVIKICGNPAKEALFETESRFYREHADCDFIPKLYVSDFTKELIGCPYEIIEKIRGKSVYYCWYLWKEEEREAFIKKLSAVMKKLHEKEVPGENWAERMRAEIGGWYEQVKERFTEAERKIVESSFEKYPEILTDVKQAEIHNDLHFDNILIDENGELRLIDFNDTLTAAFDFDFRQLFLCRELAHRWADEAMDPLQKNEDFAHIGEYLLKYDEELAAVPRVYDRMEIYAVWNEMSLLVRGGGQELVDHIVEYSKRILKA